MVFIPKDNIVKLLSVSVSIFLICFISFFKSYIAINYVLNAKYIENNYCKNKNNYQLNCHGKCYLSVQLNKVQEQESDSNIFKNILLQISEKDYVPNNFYSCDFSMLTINRDYIDNVDISYNYSSALSVFHPPKFAC